MSEETPKITAVNKEKDPNHVEAGKRLAELNRERNKKKKEHSIRKESSNDNGSFNYGLIVNTIGVAISLISLYYLINSNKKT